MGHLSDAWDRNRPRKGGWSLEKLIALQQRIAPELTSVILSRYRTLRTVFHLQPIGRRALAEHLHDQERKVRNEVEFLREREWVVMASQGMQVTPAGETLLVELEEYIRILQGLSVLETEIADHFGLRKVMIVPGDSDEDDSAKKEMARITAGYLSTRLANGSILAVTGGTTLAQVAAALRPTDRKREITVVPARGGLGEEMEIQANNIAAAFAKGLGASYRLLHVPDALGPEALHSIIGEPKVKEILELLRRADIVLHGIGAAEEMAARRGMEPAGIEELTRKGAVGEAFGYYFDLRGQVVHSTSSVGLRLEELSQMGEVIAVSGGCSKAPAAAAVLSCKKQDVFITDEGLARELSLFLKNPEGGWRTPANSTPPFME